MRTQDEILQRINTRKDDDFFGFEVSEYTDFLDWEHVQEFLEEGATEEQWNKMQLQDPILAMKGYMPFAWRKANHCRGISANRSISHCIAWLWLAGEDDLLAHVEDEYETNYHYYGKPILEMICDHFGWEWTQWDDRIRTNG